MRHVFSSLIALLVILIGIPVLVIWGVRTTILESEPWQDSLQQARVYDRIYDELLPELISDAQKGDSVVTGIPLGTPDLVAIIKESIPLPFVKDQVERGLKVAFDLVHSRTSAEQFSFIIPLQDVKRRVPIAIQESLVAKLKALPVCTPEKLSEYEKRKTLNDVLPPCLPKGTNARALVEEAVTVSELTKDIPDTLDVSEKLKEVRTQDGSSGVQVLQRIQDNVKKAFSVHLLLTIFWVLLALGVGACQLPHYRRALLWSGIVLFIVGTLTFSSAVVAKNLPDRLQQQGQDNSQAMQIAQPVIDSVMVKVTTRTQLIGAGVAAGGMVIFALAFTIRRKRIDAVI